MRRLGLGLLVASLSRAWIPARSWPPSPRAAALRGSPGAEAETAAAPKKLGVMQPKTELGQGITKDSIDMRSAGETFEFLCKMAGTPVDRNSAMPFDGFVLAFEQLYTNGEQLDPEQYDWIQAEVNSPDDEDVTLSDWAQFHERYCERSTMMGFVKAELKKKLSLIHI